MNPVLERLRPAPYRGDITAAGAIPLALSAIVIDLRMTQWSAGVRLVVVALIALLILTMGWLTPLDGPAPTQYHSMLLIAGLLPLLLALQLLADVLGANSYPPPFAGAGRLAWTFAAEAAAALACARRANSAACTLIAALAGAVAVESAVRWIFGGDLDTIRLVLFLLSLCFAAGAVRLRDGQRRHAVALVNAAGLAALTLGATYAIVISFEFVSLGSSSVQSLAFGRASGPVGWELYLLAIGFGLIGYAGSDREPGPAYIGVLVLLSFAVMAGAGHGTLIGWPLVLLALGVVGLVIGLRPSTPAPPPPPTTVAPTIPLGRDRS
jgi:hypothetical protein